MSGDNSVVDPPNSMPNLEVKRNSADGSVGPPHVRVGHRQTPNLIKTQLFSWVFSYLTFDNPDSHITK